jgi:alkaline phosphatase
VLNRRTFFTRSALTAGAALAFARLGHSQEMLRDAPGQKPAAINHLVADGLSSGTLAAADCLSKLLRNKGFTWIDVMNSPTAQLGWLLANYTPVGWTSGAHTADYVPLTATGSGSEHFAGFIQNVDVFRQYTRLAGIDFRNPEEPLIAASAHDFPRRVVASRAPA